MRTVRGREGALSGAGVALVSRRPRLPTAAYAMLTLSTSPRDTQKTGWGG